MAQLNHQQALEAAVAELDELPRKEVSNWRNRTAGVLRGIFGPDHPSLTDLKNVRWSPVVSLSSTPASVRETAFRAGQRGARGILEGALKEVALTAPDGDAVDLIDTRRIFVVSGRDLAMLSEFFMFMRSIGLAPIEWSEAVSATGKASPYVGDILDAAFSSAAAVVVLMTPDDLASLRTELRSPSDPDYEQTPTGQPRQNVLFEAGMAMGRDSNRTILVEVGALRPFSDIGGRHVIRLTNDTKRRQELAQRLRDAGCDVNLVGTDWHDAGNLELEPKPVAH